MAKKKKQPKVIGKIKYRQRKVNALKKKINHFKKTDGRKKLLFEGKQKTKKQILNTLFDRAIKINNEITSLKKKTKKYKPRKIKFGLTEKEQDKYPYEIELSKAWERQNISNFIFKSKKINTINGISPKKDAEKVNELLNDYMLNMDSGSVIAVALNKKGEAILFIVNESDEVNED